MTAELLEELKEAVINYEQQTATDIARQLIKNKVDLLEIITEVLNPAMRTVGARFEKGEYFLTDLLLAGEVMETVTQMLTSAMEQTAKEEFKREREKAKKIVIGTVQGDIHDIGKNIVSSLLRSNGYNVFDVGKDVPSKKFVEKAEDVNADVIALSALLTITLPYQADVINKLKEMGLREKYRVLVGGGPTTQEWADNAGADGWGPTAIEAIDLVARLTT